MFGLLIAYFGKFMCAKKRLSNSRGVKITVNTGTITLNSLCSAVSAAFLMYCIFSFSCVLQLAVLYGTVLYFGLNLSAWGHFLSLC